MPSGVSEFCEGSSNMDFDPEHHMLTNFKGLDFECSENCNGHLNNLK